MIQEREYENIEQNDTLQEMKQYKTINVWFKMNKKG